MLPHVKSDIYALYIYIYMGSYNHTLYKRLALQEHMQYLYLTTIDTIHKQNIYKGSYLSLITSTLHDERSKTRFIFIVWILVRA